MANPDLAARLKRVAGRHTVQLTHYGRKTGQPHQVTIWFVISAGKVYLSTANIARQWVKNVQQTPRVRLNIGGELFDGQARFLSDPAEKQQALRLAGRKYWPFFPILMLAWMLHKVGMTPDRTGAFEVTMT
jgi:deazaflavin-dependent oxidoreductase (nitroreductase family)